MMIEPSVLSRPPIVEAVVDIDCDMPPGQDLAAVDAPARERFADQYPKFQVLFRHEGQIELKPDDFKMISGSRQIRALQFSHGDGKQVVQVRTLGFSFNRLTPYSSLDAYLPELERTWRLFVEIATPLQIKVIRLRYINRIELPTIDGRIELRDYLAVSPELPDATGLTFVGFFSQQAAVEEGTRNEANIILTTQPSRKEVFPIIFDITVGSPGVAEPDDWAAVLSRLQSLRSLKNRIFWNTLTAKCLNLFR